MREREREREAQDWGRWPLSISVAKGGEHRDLLLRLKFRDCVLKMKELEELSLAQS